MHLIPTFRHLRKEEEKFKDKWAAPDQEKCAKRRERRSPDASETRTTQSLKEKGLT